MWRRCRRSLHRGHCQGRRPYGPCHRPRLHTNVVLVEQDGVATLDKRDTDTAAAGDSDVVSPEQIASFLTVRSIWDYCTEDWIPARPHRHHPQRVQVNTTISDEVLPRNTALPLDAIWS